MEVRDGYKQTEVGPIPENWTVRPLGEVVTFLDEKRRPVKDADRARMQGTIPYYGASGIVDYVNDYLFDEDLILLGEDGENILSRNCRLAFRISGKAWVNNHAHVLKPNADVSIGFLTEFLESLNYERFNSGTAQPKLNKQTCSRILVMRPSTKNEEEAIAGVLSDADALIESLERLIIKKRQLKQGAMEELLTGKNRLPGFTEHWATRPLGEVAPLQRGFDLPNSKLQQGPYPVAYSNGVLNHHNVYQVNGPGVVTGRSGTIGRVTFVEQDFWPHNTSLWVTSFRGNDPKFVFYLYTRIGLERFATGSGVPTLNRNDVHAFRVSIPVLKAEQEAIATTISDMDVEIDALEAKLAKALSVKQGMMQQLLTGKVRLL